MHAEVDVFEFFRNRIQEILPLFRVEIALPDHSKMPSEIGLVQIRKPPFFITGQWEYTFIVSIYHGGPTRATGVEVPRHEKYLAIRTPKYTIVPFSRVDFCSCYKTDGHSLFFCSIKVVNVCVALLSVMNSSSFRMLNRLIALGCPMTTRSDADFEVARFNAR